MLGREGVHAQRFAIRGLAGRLQCALGPAEFVAAAVDRDTPEIGGEAGVGAKRVAVGEDTGKRLLGQVFGAVGIAQHPGAKAADGLLPTADQLGKGLGIILRLDTPHELLVGGSEDRLDRLPG